MRWALLFLAGCSTTHSTATVLDAQGLPLEGVVATAIGSSCRAVSDAAGKLDLPCDAGSVDLIFARDGYISHRQTYVITEGAELAPITLIPTPPGDGLFRLDLGAWKPLPPAKLHGVSTGQGERICLDREASEPLRSAPGVLALLDQEAASWRAYRVDADGCVFSSVAEGGKLVSKPEPKPDAELISLPGRRNLTLMQLEVGDVVIAPLEAGYFTRIPGSKPAAYRAHWVEVR